jgi:S-disulfanyl-L-cysteine oxidoreductase SoxD
MLKFPELALLCGLALLLAAPVEAAGDPEKGAAVFKKCGACHQVGDDAKNRIGPHLNGLIGRTAGALDGFKYSKAMQDAGAGGMVWTVETLDAYLESPRTAVKGTRMAFPGLKDADDRADAIAYLAEYSKQATAPAETKTTAAPAESPAPATAAETATGTSADQPVPTHGVLHLGRVATPDEIAAWDIDVRPDGAGLPAGKGTVAQGEVLFTERCASCHGDFGEGTGRWPVLAGGRDTLKNDRPEKTIGSYWPYLSTVYDYVRRAMPYGDARSLNDDEVYAITAYLLYLNDVVTDDAFVLSSDNFSDVRLPNEANFTDDTRQQEAHYTAPTEPCMRDCKADVTITSRARVLNVTPDGGGDSDSEAATKVD